MPRNRPTFRTFLSMLLLFGLALGVFAGVAHADKVHKKYKGDIILSRSPFPTSFDGASDALKYIKKVKETEFVKDKRGKWNIEYWAFLKSPLETKDAVILFFDVTYNEEPTEVYSTGVRPNDPYDDFIMSYIELDEEFFKAGMTYEMRIQRSRNTKPLAVAEFKLTD